MKGVRGALGAALGLALMQLLLSSSQKKGPTLTMITALFSWPAMLVSDLIDPDSAAIPDLSTQGTPTKTSATGPSSGLSGTGTPAGTGSNLISI